MGAEVRGAGVAGSPQGRRGRPLLSTGARWRVGYDRRVSDPQDLLRGWRYRAVVGVTALVLLGAGFQALWSVRDGDEDPQSEDRDTYLFECDEAVERCEVIETVVVEGE